MKYVVLIQSTNKSKKNNTISNIKIFKATKTEYKRKKSNFVSQKNALANRFNSNKFKSKNNKNIDNENNKKEKKIEKFFTENMNDNSQSLIHLIECSSINNVLNINKEQLRTDNLNKSISNRDLPKLNEEHRIIPSIEIKNKIHKKHRSKSTFNIKDYNLKIKENNINTLLKLKNKNKFTIDEKIINKRKDKKLLVKKTLNEFKRESFDKRLYSKSLTSKKRNYMKKIYDFSFPKLKVVNINEVDPETIEKYKEKKISFCDFIGSFYRPMSASQLNSFVNMRNKIISEEQLFNLYMNIISLNEYFRNKAIKL